MSAHTLRSLSVKIKHSLTISLIKKTILKNKTRLWKLFTNFDSLAERRHALVITKKKQIKNAKTNFLCPKKKVAKNIGRKRDKKKSIKLIDLTCYNIFYRFVFDVCLIDYCKSTGLKWTLRCAWAISCKIFILWYFKMFSKNTRSF